MASVNLVCSVCRATAPVPVSSAISEWSGRLATIACWRHNRVAQLQPFDSVMNTYWKYTKPPRSAPLLHGTRELDHSESRTADLLARTWLDRVVVGLTLVHSWRGERPLTWEAGLGQKVGRVMPCSVAIIRMSVYGMCRCVWRCLRVCTQATSHKYIWLKTSAVSLTTAFLIVKERLSLA